MTTTHQTTDWRSASAGRLPTALLTIALLTLGGCDLFDGGLTFSGVVVDSVTGAPLDSIHVSLQTGGGFGLYTTAEAGFTDQEGQFTLQTSRQDAYLFVNSPGYGGSALARLDYGSAGPLLHRTGAMRIELMPLTP